MAVKSPKFTKIDTRLGQKIDVLGVKVNDLGPDEAIVRILRLA